MPTTQSHTSKSSSNRKSAASKSKSTTKRSAAASRQKDAIQLLKADHREVEQLFKDFQKASGDTRKMQLSQKICMELMIHTQIEEEIFYPACREMLKDDEIVNESIVEHQAAKDLIEEIRGMQASDEMFDARMQVLQEQIEHHVEEEEKELFPQAQKTDMDLKAIGEQLMMRKQELQGQMEAEGMGTEMH
jgi:hemerythrin superfamily protein